MQNRILIGVFLRVSPSQTLASAMGRKKDRAASRPVFGSRVSAGEV